MTKERFDEGPSQSAPSDFTVDDRPSTAPFFPPTASERETFPPIPGY